MEHAAAYCYKHTIKEQVCKISKHLNQKLNNDFVDYLIQKPSRIKYEKIVCLFVCVEA